MTRKAIKNARQWLEDVDESACCCDVGDGLDCVQTSVIIVKSLIRDTEQHSKIITELLDLAEDLYCYVPDYFLKKHRYDEQLAEIKRRIAESD